MGRPLLRFYSPSISSGPRKGDNAPMVIMELVTEPCTPKKKAVAEPVEEAKLVAEAKIVEDETLTEPELPASDEAAAPAEDEAKDKAEA